MKLNTSIQYLDYYVPSNFVLVDEILELNKEALLGSNQTLDEGIQQFKDQSGLNRISVFGPKEDIATIAAEMVGQLLNTTRVQPAKIKYLICGNPVLMEGSVSVIHYVQRKHRLTHCPILPLFQPCASTAIAMGLSEKLLDKSAEEYLLVVTARKCRDLANRYVGYTIYADGVGVSLVGNVPGRASLRNWCWLNNGATSLERMEGAGGLPNVGKLRWNIVRNGVAFLRGSLEEMGLELTDVDRIIHPNTYFDVFHKLYADLLGVPPEKFYLDNMSFGGHINDVDLVRNTKDYLDALPLRDKASTALIYAIDLSESLDTNYHLLQLDIETTERAGIASRYRSEDFDNHRE